MQISPSRSAWKDHIKLLPENMEAPIDSITFEYTHQASSQITAMEKGFLWDTVVYYNIWSTFLYIVQQIDENKITWTNTTRGLLPAIPGKGSISSNL